MSKLYIKGWKSTTPTGSTIEIIERKPDGSVDIVCSKCHRDIEMFPEPINVKRPSELLRKVPCECSGAFRKSKDQWKVKIIRECSSRGYEFLGFSEEFKGNKTKIELFNPETNNKWNTCSILNFFSGRGDPSEHKMKMRNLRGVPVNERKLQVESTLRDEGNRQVIELIESDLQPSYRRFQWKCKRGHLIESTFNNFINKGTRCKICHHLNNTFSGFLGGCLDRRRKDTDFLYIMKIEKGSEVFYKIGRSFNVTRRLAELAKVLKVYGFSISVSYMEKGVHEYIVKREGQLLKQSVENSYLPSVSFDGYTECREGTLESLIA